jgi:Mg2+ and Co2+ transporter CorA
MNKADIEQIRKDLRSLADAIESDRRAIRAALNRITVVEEKLAHLDDEVGQTIIRVKGLLEREAKAK